MATPVDAAGDAMGGVLSSRFEYRGWLVCVEVGDAADPRSCYAELSYRGHHVCRVGLGMALDTRALPWALDSKACDFIDRWSAGPRQVARPAARFDLDIS